MDSNGQFICAGATGAGPGVNLSAKAGYTDSMYNDQILKAAWPYYYAPYPGGWSNGQETMASINADQSGGFSQAGPELSGATQDAGQWLFRFKCTGGLVYNLAYQGTTGTLCTQ
jgi:hypothetical protein